MEADFISQAMVAHYMRVSPQKVGEMLRKSRPVTPAIVNAVARLARIDDGSRAELHRMAAREAGWEIGE